MIARRTLIKTLLAVGGLGAASAALLAPRRANAYYQGPPSDHFDGLQFFNPGREEPQGLRAFLRWNFLEPAERWPESFPSPHRDRPPPRVSGARARVAYVGHASFLLQAGDLNILIDPVWGERASPVSFAGPKRVNAPGIAFDDLPPIDIVLVTHNHYDHMDMATVRRLVARGGRVGGSRGPRFITPLGNDSILLDGAPGIHVEAHDWDAVVPVSPEITIHVEPTQHWSARGTGDRRHALWASFIIATPAGKIYAVGDSGMGDGHMFRRVAGRHPRIRLALLPIGAYEPRWFMRAQHMAPDEAVEALRLCGAEQALGHHWGTFCLTNEAVDAPPRELDAALAEAGIPPARFRALRPGEAVEVG